MPPIGEFEDAAFLGARVGEGALLVTEELAFQQGFRDGGAVDGDEGFGLAQALVVQGLGDQILTGPVLAFEQNGGGFAGGHAAYEIEHFAHGRRFGDNLAFLRRGFLGDVLDGGHHAGKVALAVEHLVGAHHHQTFHAVVGMQADRAVGRGWGLVQAHQHAASRLAEGALEDVLAMLAEHLLGRHAEEFLRGPVDAGDAELRIVQNQGVGKLVEHRFQYAGLLPTWGELRH